MEDTSAAGVLAAARGSCSVNEKCVRRRWGGGEPYVGMQYHPDKLERQHLYNASIQHAAGKGLGRGC